MEWIIAKPITSLAYGFLYLSVLSLWFPGKRPIPNWCITITLSILLGLISHLLDLIALLPISVLAVTAYYSQAEKPRAFMRNIASVAVLGLSVGLATHQFPGFNNVNAIDHAIISHNAISYTYYLNFDKALVGILILGFSRQLISGQDKWLSLFKKIIFKLPLVILITIIAAFVLGFITFDFKIPNGIFIWIMTNLLFVCVAEEALFRAFFQHKLSLSLKNFKYGNYFSVLSTALIFGLAHYPGGKKYAILAMIAGIGYGWVYVTTKRIEASILTHFGLNLTHILFFTYPALQGAM